jgi:hypothetical protein
MKFYKLEFSANNCKYDARVSDFPVLFDNNGYQLNTIVPLNHLIFENYLLLVIKILPIDGQPTLNKIASLNIRIFSVNENGKTENTLFEFSSNFNENQVPEYYLKKQIPIEHLENNLAWVKGENIKLNKQVVLQLNQKYQNIWRSFKTNDLKTLEQDIELREICYATSYGVKTDTRTLESMEEYSSFINDHDYDLFDLKLDYFTIKLACMNKVIYMEDDEGFHPIFFLRKNKKGSINIPIYLSLLAGEFKITL